MTPEVKAKLTAVALAAGLAGAGAAWLARRGETDATPAVGWGGAVLALVVGWSYVGSGLVAWRHRPDNRLGPVMVLIGLTWFATFLADAAGSLAFTVGTAVESVYLVGFIYLVLSFPSGAPRGRGDGALVASGVVLVTVVQLAWMLFADSRAVICPECPDNAFEIARHDALADGILQGQRICGVLLSILTV